MKKHTVKTTVRWEKKHRRATFLAQVKKVLLWLLLILFFNVLGWLLASNLR